MNPTRANIVKSPENYIWSSHSVYLRRSEITWLTSDHGLSKFGKNKDIAKRLYSAYVLEQESSEEHDELRNSFKDGQVLGDDTFLAERKMGIKWRIIYL